MLQYNKDLGRVSVVAEGVWNNNKDYDKLSIVYNKCDKFAYISRKTVPAGVDIENREYWQPLNINGYADNNFINLTTTDENNNLTAYDNIVEAATSVNAYNRRVGAVLSFYNINSERLDRQAEFELWQFNSTDVNNWTKESAWQNIYYNWNVFVGWYIGLDSLKNHIANPTVGQYAYIGSTLNDAVLVQCRTNNVWTLTNTKIRDYISVKVEGNVTIGSNGHWYCDGNDTGIPATPSVDEELDNIVTQIKTINTTLNALHTEDARIEEKIDSNKETLDKKIEDVVLNLQKQITSNDEDISDLQTKVKQNKDTIDGIAASGGASVASAVTYDNAASGLESENVQNAIDELKEATSKKISEDDIEDNAVSIKKMNKDLEIPLSQLSGESIPQAIEEVAIIDDTDKSTIVSITPEGCDFKNLKSDGNRVLTEKDRLAQVATGKKDNEEQVWSNDEETEEYAKIGSYGIVSKAFHDSDGNRVLTEKDRLAQVATGKKIIFDTDFGGDVDDLFCPTILSWAERNGLIEILGVHCSVPRFGETEIGSYDAISAINAAFVYYGINGLLYGLDKQTPTARSSYCSTACTYPYNVSSVQALDSPDFYRKALLSLGSDEKADVVITGYMSGFSRFLDSKKDKDSALTGLELANSKIRRLYILGGSYPEGCIETNLAGNPNTPEERIVSATNNVFQNFKGEIIFVGIEHSDIHISDVLVDNNMDWLFSYKCADEFITTNYESLKAANSLPDDVTTKEQYWKYRIQACDNIAVMLLCDNNTDISGFDLVRGQASIETSGNDYGKNSFTQNDVGNHYFVKKKKNRTAKWYTARLDSIIKEENWNSLVPFGERLGNKASLIMISEYDITISSSNSLFTKSMELKKGSLYTFSVSSLSENATINFYRSGEDQNTGKNLLGQFLGKNKGDITKFKWIEGYGANLLHVGCYSMDLTSELTIHVQEETLK